MVASVNSLALATRSGQEDKSLRTLINLNSVDLSALTTTEKSNLVGAINEVNAALAAGVTFNDAGTGLTDALSANQISIRIQAAIDALVGGAPALLDTLSELAAALQGNDADITAILTAQGANTANITAAQATADQAVLDAASASTAAGVAAAAATAANTAAGTAQAGVTTNAGTITALSAAVGDTDADLVSAFEAALA